MIGGHRGGKAYRELQARLWFNLFAFGLGCYTVGSDGMCRLVDPTTLRVGRNTRVTFGGFDSGASYGPDMSEGFWTLFAPSGEPIRHPYRTSLGSGVVLP